MLCSALLLDVAAPRYETLYRSRNATKTRAAQRAGIETVLGGRELMEDFTTVLEATYQRHGVAPTHSLAELNDLLDRMPARFRIRPWRFSTVRSRLAWSWRFSPWHHF